MAWAAGRVQTTLAPIDVNGPATIASGHYRGPNIRKFSGSA